MTENPCNECENCKMILEDKALEVVEMDAASNRRIDDIRELKRKSNLSPTNRKIQSLYNRRSPYDYKWRL